LAHSCGGESVDEFADARPDGVDGALVGFAQQRFQFGEDLLDRIEVGAVGRQEHESGAGAPDRGANRPALVAAQIVHDDDVAGRERGDQHLLDIGQERRAVDRSVDDARRGQAVGAQRRQKGRGAPAAVRNPGYQPLAFLRPPVRARHVGLGPGFRR